MDVNSFTHRAAEALATAQREARSSDHQRIEPEHLLVAHAEIGDPVGNEHVQLLESALIELHQLTAQLSALRLHARRERALQGRAASMPPKS